MYGEKWRDPAFNAIAFYLHVAGTGVVEMSNVVDMLAEEGF
jgi:hypothetical protein